MGALLAAIPAVAGLAGTFMQGKQQQAAASAQQAFEERMSSTSWQRGVADMRKAGINPALSYSAGGASTPMGATAQVPDYGSAVSGALSSAIQVAKLPHEIALLGAQKYAAEQAGFKAGTEGQVTGQELDTDQGPGGKSFWQQRFDAAMGLMEAQASSARSVASLNRAALPAAGVTGSKFAGWLRTLLPGLQAAAKGVEAFGP